MIKQTKQKKFSRLAVWGFICAFFFALLGIILSSIAIREIDADNKNYTGKVLAQWGLGIAIANIVIGILMVFA